MNYSSIIFCWIIHRLRRFHSKFFVDRFMGSGIYNLFDLILSGQEDRERKREEEEKKIDTRRTLWSLHSTRWFVASPTRSPLLYPFSLVRWLAARLPPRISSSFCFRSATRRPLSPLKKLKQLDDDGKFILDHHGWSFSLFSKPTWNSWRLDPPQATEGRVGGHLRVNMSPADPALWSRIAL